MSRVQEQFREDSNKAPKDLEHEIDGIRNHMEHTLDLLERKLSPGDIIDSVLNMVRGNGGGFAQNLTTQVQNNPLPTLLTSVGLVWLMSASDRPPPRGNGFGDDQAHRTMQGAMGSARNAARRVQEGGHDLGERAHELGERVSGAASQAGHSMHAMADSMRDSAHRAGESARRGVRRMEGQYEHLLEEQPLLLGALGFALGAALGAMVPRTEVEDELMGEYSDRVKHEVADEGREQYQRARDTAERVAGAVQREVTHGKDEGGNTARP
jgi:hypothetical protein